jgi:hypothetical protein
MRKAVGLVVLAVAVVATSAWLELRRERSVPPGATAPAVEQPTPPAASPTPPAAVINPAPLLEQAAAPDLPGADAAPAQEFYAIDRELVPEVERYRTTTDPVEREDALLNLALSDDKGVFDFLMDELHAAKPLQRGDILDAITQYGDRRAIPELRELARTALTTSERQALAEAADYLALPSFTELRTGAWKPGDPPPSIPE